MRPIDGRGLTLSHLSCPSEETFHRCSCEAAVAVAGSDGFCRTTGPDMCWLLLGLKGTSRAFFVLFFWRTTKAEVGGYLSSSSMREAGHEPQNLIVIDLCLVESSVV